MLNATSLIPRLAGAAERHLHTVFGDVAPLTPWRGPLPYYLADGYVFYEGRVGGAACIFMTPAAPDIVSAAALVKQRTAAQSFVSEPLVILLLAGLRPHDRRVLVEAGSPFIVPGNQLFAPRLGLDLRERIRPPAATAGAHLTPAAQLVVLAALVGQEVDGANASELGKRLAYTPMSMLRVLKELESLELAEVRVAGRERQIVLVNTGRALWDRALPMMRTPVRKRRTIAYMPPDFPACRAGQTALASYTMLAPPNRETWAISAREWKNLAPRLPTPKIIWEEQFVELETWTYDPTLLARDGVVDPLSLYLSLEDRRDERLDMAADQLIERFAW